ncbi:MAG: hypothetical protein EP341_00850 [Sphingomonadales bacterium]|nr:MAG: hypothetical protein EP341_00850 [Sphingomonadales bacterium]
MRIDIGNGNHVEAVTIAPLIENKRDATANDSDKSWVVPGNELWKITHACVNLTTTATVGNRIMTLRVDDPDGNQIKNLVAGAVQAASADVFYCMIQGIYRETSVINGAIQVPLPADFYVIPNSTIRFYDSAAIDAAADDMIVNFQVEIINV